MSGHRQRLGDPGSPQVNALATESDRRNANDVLGLDALRPIPVSRLAGRLKRIIEGLVGRVWIVGEVSGVHQRNGTLYFTLTEGGQHVECVWFRAPANSTLTVIQDGMQVVARGTPRVFTRPLALPFVVVAARRAGDGEGKRALEALRRQLQREGVFDAKRKRRLPRVPRSVAVITSRGSDAWEDMRAIARRRHPGLRLVLVTAQMQGAEAPASIADALQRVALARVCDVVILTRGGGAATDLASFDHEAVVRAIAACPVPVVSAIGHQADNSLADAAADHRAATPSDAASCVVPRRDRLEADARRHRDWITEAIVERIGRERDRAGAVRDALARAVLVSVSVGRRSLERAVPELRVGVRRRLDRARAMVTAARATVGRNTLDTARSARRRFEITRRSLDDCCRHELSRERASLEAGRRSLTQIVEHRLARERAGYDRVDAALAALDPLAVLRRGYAVARGPAGEVLSSACDFEPDGVFTLQLGDGAVLARVVRATAEGPTFISGGTT